VTSTCKLGTEFGRVLEDLMLVPGAAGAVLSDERGYAIDYVRKKGTVSDVDVQLLGAQLGQALEKLDEVLRRRGLLAPVVVIEGDRRALVIAPIDGTYAMALLLLLPANVALALRRFDVGRDRLARLLA
jgi:hypothetical protein